MSRTRGVLYVATGDRYFAEALVSAGSLRASNPSIPIAIVTDRARARSVFDHEIILENPRFNMADKCSNLLRTPFEETLYLDADTYVVGDISTVFDMLARFDVAGAHEVARGYWYRGKIDVPDSFVELNGGVLAFRRNERVERFMQRWVESFHETQSWLGKSTNAWVVNNDQVSLRLALWQCTDLQVAVLPPEFNALRNWGTYLWGAAVIIHGRGDLPRVARQFNASVNVERVYLQQYGMWGRPEDIPLGQLFSMILRVPPAFFFTLCRRITGFWRRSIRGKRG